MKVVKNLRGTHLRNFHLKNDVKADQSNTVMAFLSLLKDDSALFGKSSQVSDVEFSEAEEILIAMVYNLVGERWSLIAGRIPGRTAEEIEKYWTSRFSTSQ
ncbi:hypothetical protein JHK85_034037 [Glycine max]|nr:hypothetical protein JHK85_034037 [Glycine max]